MRPQRRQLERGAAPPARRAPEPAASIAVLPFANRSASADDEYFSDGLADELINVLAKIRGLRVAARTSSFQFKNRNEDLALIGQKINVAALLEGSVRRAGNRVRISVQLVKVADGFPLWSETYDRTLDDIFAVQDDIAQSVVKELRARLLGELDDSVASGEARAEVAQAARGRGSDAEAHRLFLQARHLNDRRTPETTERSIDYLRQALARDPNFALAWAELARVYMTQAGQGWADAEPCQQHAREAVARALALEPDLAEAHAQAGWIQMYVDWNWKGAELSIARAQALAPGNAPVLRSAATLALNLGRLDRAAELYARVVEQDPLSAGSYHNLGLALFESEQFQAAESAYRRALELAPQRISDHAKLAVTLSAMGRHDEAVEAASLEPEPILRYWALAIVEHARGDRAASDVARNALAEQFGNEARYTVGEVHAARGEVDQAFEWYERSLQAREGPLAEMKPRRFNRSLHGDPRWSALLSRVGFEA